MNEDKNAPNSLMIEQVRLLYRHLPASLIMNSLLAVILITVQAPVVPAPRRIGWLFVLGMALLTRLALLHSWRQTTVDNLNAAHWLRLFRITVTATGLVWGIGGVILAPASNLAHQIFVVFVLGGLCAGAITSLMTDWISTTGFLFPTLAPFVLYLAFQGSDLFLGMSAMTTLFLIFILASARQSRHTFWENFRLRIKAVESEARFREILEHSPVAARILDISTNHVTFANRSYSELVGVPLDQINDLDPSRVYARPEEFHAVTEKVSRGENVDGQLMELLPLSEPDKPKWVLATHMQIEFHGKPGYLAWLYDITDRKRIEEETQYLAYHDALTKLPNRILLRDRLQQALVVAERNETALALIFLDLDHFKSVNDSYGHDFGDRLLQESAKRISACLRKSDSVARIGGDEFIVLLPVVKTSQNALTVAKQIQRALDEPTEIDGRTVHISGSIGLALYPEHAANDRDLITLADTAMYYAKAEGRNSVQLYRAGMEDDRYQPPAQPSPR